MSAHQAASATSPSLKNTRVDKCNHTNAHTRNCVLPAGVVSWGVIRVGGALKKNLNVYAVVLLLDVTVYQNRTKETEKSYSTYRVGNNVAGLSAGAFKFAPKVLEVKRSKRHVVGRISLTTWRTESEKVQSNNRKYEEKTHVDTSSISSNSGSVRLAMGCARHVFCG